MEAGYLLYLFSLSTARLNDLTWQKYIQEYRISLPFTIFGPYPFPIKVAFSYFPFDARCSLKNVPYSTILQAIISYLLVLFPLQMTPLDVICGFLVFIIQEHIKSIASFFKDYSGHGLVNSVNREEKALNLLFTSGLFFPCAPLIIDRIIRKKMLF